MKAEGHESQHRGLSGSAIAFLGDRVRKTAQPGGSRKLKAQFDNTRRLRRSLGDRAVDVVAWQEDHYDMVFCPGVGLDVYCTMTTQRIAFARLQEIVSVLWRDLYADHAAPPAVAGYVDYLVSVARRCGERGRDVERLLRVLGAIGSRLDGRTFLEQRASGVVHGDLTFENIIVTADSFVLIDSNPPPGGCASMAMDLGKLRQSLFARWELAKFAGPRARAGLEATYSYIADRFAYLTPSWNESLEFESRFYEASHYLRLVPYRERHDPGAAAFYLERAATLLEETLSCLGEPRRVRRPRESDRLVATPW